MTGSERFSVLAALPPHGEWRRALALDRTGPEPRPVILAWVPPERLSDPERLVGLLTDVEAAAHLRHECAAQVIGSETVHDALAVVEAYRPGTSLRALLDAGGRLPGDVAARIAVDACAGLAAAHALDLGGGRLLVHGALAPTRIEIGDDGAAAVLGFGSGEAAEGTDAVADVRALAAALHECLAGEPPGRPPAPLEEAGVPAPLAAAVARGLAAGAGAPLTAAELAAAVTAAGPVASRAEVAAYVDAILPPDEGSRAELARLVAGPGAPADAVEVSPDDIVEPTEPGTRAAPAPAPAPAAAATGAPAIAAPAREPPAPAPAPVAPRAVEPTPEPLPRPPATRPGVDPAGVFAAPVRPPARSRAPLVAAVLCAIVGFGAGLAAERSIRATRQAGAHAARDPGAEAAPAEPVVPAPPSPVPAAVEAPRGKAAAPAAAPKRPSPPAERASRPARGQRAAPAARKGTLNVAAPPDAEVFLDGRRVGRGEVHLEVTAGPHRVEVRRGGARVGQDFTVAPDETWTYDVTPTPPTAN